MKKVLYITTLSSTINAFLVPHIEKLKKKGNRVDCAARINKELDEKLVNLGVNLFNVPFTRNPTDINNVRAFKELIKIQNENQYDIVHVHTPIAALYGRLLKIKYPYIKTIYTVHGFHFYKGAPKQNWIIYYPIEKVMSNLTDIIITMNEEDYSQAIKFNIKNTFKINGVGVDLDKYNINQCDRNIARESIGLKEDDFVLLMIAEVNKNKNHKQMIDAIDMLKKKGIDNIKVICAGSGPLLESIKEYIKNKRLNENIIMLGYRKDVNEIISACDIGILMSYREGLPRNIMELMACKKPVIGTNIRGIRDLIKDGVNGFLVALNDYERTAEKIELLYKNKKLLNDMSSNAYEIVKEYDLQKVLEQIESVF